MWAAKLAVESYREAFHKDVVIDLVCFRRRGHNEGDDPSMTQPAMYDVIDTKRGVRKSYTEALIGRGDISTKEAEDALRDYQGQLERSSAVRNQASSPSPAVVEANQTLALKVETAVDKSVLEQIGDAFFNVPEGFTAHQRVKPVLKRRHEMSRGHFDWAFAELLAFGSLVLEGTDVRLSGQDSRRSTFTQRHSVLIDRTNGSEYTPLNHLSRAALAVSTSTTRRCRSSRCSVSSTATRWAIPTHSCCGRGSSVTSSTAPSRSSASSSPPVRPSGVSSPMWCCCCRTATRVRVPTTPRAVSSGSCSCAPRFDDGRAAVDPGQLLPPAAPASTTASAAR